VEMKEMIMHCAGPVREIPSLICELSSYSNFSSIFRYK